MAGAAAGIRRGTTANLLKASARTSTITSDTPSQRCSRDFFPRSTWGIGDHGGASGGGLPRDLIKLFQEWLRGMPGGGQTLKTPL